jgi:hypothetical protein
MVRVTLKDGPRRRISPAGGELSLNVPGARVTLDVPPGALERTTLLSLSAATVEGLPFAAGAIAAISVQPADFPLRRPVRLTVQRTGRSPLPDGEPTGFGVDAAGELHLAFVEPALSEAAASRGAMTVVMPRPGIYGLGIPTASEVEALSRREPSSYLARLEHRAARAYPRSTGAPSTLRRSFALIPAVHARETEPAWILELVRHLTDTYDHVVKPKFERIRTPNCSGIEAEVADAIRAFNHWMALVELLLPVELDRDLYQYPGYRDSYTFLVEQRRQLLRDRGYSDAQIDELTKAFEKYRDSELTRRGDQGSQLVIEAKRKAFDELYRCCMFVKALEHYPSTMIALARSMALSSAEYEKFGLDKVRQCNCRAQSAKPGALRGFEGTIEFTESFDADSTVPGGNRTDDFSLTFTYTNELEILFPHTERQFVADYKLSGSLERSFQRREQSTCEGRIDVQERYSQGRDSGRSLVNLFVRDTGEYTLSFDNLLLELSGYKHERREWVGANCGPFVKGKVLEKRSFSDAGVNGLPQNVTVSGRVDPSKPLEFRGAETFEGEYRGSPGGLSIPAGAQGPTRRSTVKWNLVACSG